MDTAVSPVNELEIWHPLAVPPRRTVLLYGPRGVEIAGCPWPEGETPGKAVAISAPEC
jgi:hypothetical protein